MKSQLSQKQPAFASSKDAIVVRPTSTEIGKWDTDTFRQSATAAGFHKAQSQSPHRSGDKELEPGNADPVSWQ